MLYTFTRLCTVTTFRTNTLEGQTVLWFLIIFYYLDCTKCKFPDFSLTFPNIHFSLTFNKIPWLFPDFCQVWNFPDFSLTAGHPDLSWFKYFVFQFHIDVVLFLLIDTK